MPVLEGICVAVCVLQPERTVPVCSIASGNGFA